MSEPGWLDDLWWKGELSRAAPLLPALAVAEGLFRTAAAFRGTLYAMGLARQGVAPAAVISVGNLAVGGTGKTPATLALAERLRRKARRVAVLSRGYGARRRDPRVVSDGARVLLPEEDAGDEPLLLARRLPGVSVLCGPDRATLARRAAAELGADALLLDDGFQHRSLARDLDIVALDAANPVGNGRLLPRGPNREPWSALARAQLAWISRADRASPEMLASLQAAARAATGNEPVVSRHAVTDVRDGTLERTRGIDALRGRRVAMLCAVARPDGFRATLGDLRAEIVVEWAFRDHHRFTAAELADILDRARRAGCEAIATTEKDAVRLPAQVATDPLWHAVRVDAEVISGEAELDAWLDRALVAGDARRGGLGIPADVTRSA